jgi:hypothetical protein
MICCFDRYEESGSELGFIPPEPLGPKKPRPPERNKAMKPTAEIPKSISKTRPVEEPAIQVEDKIRKRAYELYEKRGRIDGNDINDWLQAECEVAKQPKAA